MRRIFSATAALLALAGTALSAAPADARWYGGGGYGGYGGYGRGYGGYGGYHHRGGGAGLAIGAGILGLAAGAAIASRPYYAAPSYGYDYGYAPGYVDAPTYYAPPPPPPPPAYGYYRPCSGWAAWHGYC